MWMLTFLKNDNNLKNINNSKKIINYIFKMEDLIKK